MDVSNQCVDFGLGDTGPRRASLQPINATSNWLYGERAGEVRETVTALARDLLAVLDAVRSRRAILLEASEDGPGCIQFAATDPDGVFLMVEIGGSSPASAEPAAPRTR